MRRLRWAACILFVFVLSQPLFAENGSLLSIEAITVEPAKAGPDTLCTLAVQVRNKGMQTASELTFEVKLSGQVVDTYHNQTFMTDVPAGKETEVKLYNFWTSDSVPPYAKDGNLVVEVRLTAARWFDGELKPLKPVEPLPPPKSRVLTR